MVSSESDHVLLIARVRLECLTYLRVGIHLHKDGDAPYGWKRFRKGLRPKKKFAFSKSSIIACTGCALLKRGQYDEETDIIYMADQAGKELGMFAFLDVISAYRSRMLVGVLSAFLNR